MSNKKHHAEWIPLLKPSGPFLSIPVLEKVFPQGLDAHDPEHVRNLRLALEEWEDNQLGRRPDPAIHNAWVQFVLKETLGLPDETFAGGQSIPQTLKATISEHGEVLRQDYAVRNPGGVPDAGKPRLLVQVYPLEQDLEKHVHGHRWKASPADRMAELLKQTTCQRANSALSLTGTIPSHPATSPLALFALQNWPRFRPRSTIERNPKNREVLFPT